MNSNNAKRAIGCLRSSIIAQFSTSQFKIVNPANSQPNLLSRGTLMPLVRISLLEGKPETYIAKVADAVHRALVETIAIPAQDRFQIITEHSKSHFIYDPEYLKIHRTGD